MKRCSGQLCSKTTRWVWF